MDGSLWKQKNTAFTGSIIKTSIETVFHLVEHDSIILLISSDGKSNDYIYFFLNKATDETCFLN